MGNGSIRMLSSKYGISLSTIQQRATKYGWVSKRQRHREDVIERASKKVADRTAKKLAKEFKIADNLSDIIQAALEDNKQFQRYIVRGNSENGSDERIFNKRDMKSVVDAVKALGGIVDIKRKISEGATDGKPRGGVILLPKVLPEPTPPKHG